MKGLEKERIDEIADLTRRLISAVGEDIKRPGLQETPERVARSYMFLTEGYEQNLNAIVNGAIFEEKCGNVNEANGGTVDEASLLRPGEGRSKDSLFTTNPNSYSCGAIAIASGSTK